MPSKPSISLHRHTLSLRRRILTATHTMHPPVSSVGVPYNRFLSQTTRARAMWELLLILKPQYKTLLICAHAYDIDPYEEDHQDLCVGSLPPMDVSDFDRSPYHTFKVSADGSLSVGCPNFHLPDAACLQTIHLTETEKKMFRAALRKWVREEPDN
jgi:hypothetical protein